MSTRVQVYWFGLCGALVVAFALACRHDRADPPISFTSVDGLVTYAGCAQVWLEAKPRCLFESGKPIRLWLDQLEGTEVKVLVDGHALPSTTQIVPGVGGLRLDARPGDDAQELVVELPSKGLRWSLPLRRSSGDVQPPPGVETSDVVYEAVRDVYQRMGEGRPSEALKRLAEVKEQAERYPKGKAVLATFRGVVLWAQGRHHDAATELRDGVSFAMRLHDPELIVDAIHMYAAAAVELGYWDAAVEWGELVLTLARDERDLIQCDSLAKIMSTVGYAKLLQARYRRESSDSARLLLEQARSRVIPAGECPGPETVQGIALSLANEALDRSDTDGALDILSTIDIHAAPTADQRVRLYDALLRALDGAGHPMAERQRVLAALEDEVTEAALPEGRWRLELRRGDLLRRQGHFEEAIAAYRKAEGEALAIAELAAVGIGRESAVTLHAQSTESLVGLLVEQDRPEQALCAAREAQARRTQGVGAVPATAQQRGVIDPAREKYELAMRELDEALASARTLTRRELKALQLEVKSTERALAKLVNEILRKQSTWRPACEELVPRRSGELFVGIYPGSGKWLVFTQNDAGTEVHELAGGPIHALDDPLLGTELLDPLSGPLAAAKRIRVLGSGRAQEIDVHLLSWRGAPLLEHAPVTYGAELPRLAGPRAPDVKPTALLVHDPTETLPQARKEVLEAANWMATRDWALNVLDPEDADRVRVLDALARSSFFYFAGHGQHRLGHSPAYSLPPYAGGSLGWPAHLRLRSGSKLEIQDVLMLTSAPTHVALLGCETGVPGSAGGGMSLALAFLVAGAEQVVATPVETTDERSQATGLGLLSGMEGPGVDLAAGLRVAQMKMLRRGIPPGRYRVWVR